MTEVLNFCKGGEREAPSPLLYRACGLDGIYLHNGYKRVDAGPYGGGVIVEDADELHKAIGLEVALARPYLTHREVRFLREQMGKSQRELGDEIGVSAQMVARYEKEDQSDITGPADRLLRAVYVTHLFPSRQSEIMGVIIALHQESEDCVTSLEFVRAGAHWFKNEETTCAL